MYNNPYIRNNRFSTNRRRTGNRKRRRTEFSSTSVKDRPSEIILQKNFLDCISRTSAMNCRRFNLLGARKTGKKPEKTGNSDKSTKLDLLYHLKNKKFFAKIFRFSVYEINQFYEIVIILCLGVFMCVCCYKNSIN